MFQSEAELEDFLSLPTEADCDAIRGLEGDLLILGVAGKMGPTLAQRAMRAARAAGVRRRIIGVSRFSDESVRLKLEASGIGTIAADLLEPDSIDRLPDAANVIFMAGRKFGSAGAERLTWATNACVPTWVARRYAQSKMVAFSSGNVYPFVAMSGGGATEETPPLPVGEYAQSVLARERIFEFFSERYGTPVCLLRLNYAVELRYGVLLDIGMNVFAGRR
jgi:nucleoside-diphosphate-sugar epimerase